MDIRRVHSAVIQRRNAILNVIYSTILSALTCLPPPIFCESLVYATALTLHRDKK